MIRIEGKMAWQSMMQTIYEIVKAHGGELKVKTEEVKGAELIVDLPII
jgi:K+-sensing histidine kinase KdpD